MHYLVCKIQSHNTVFEDSNFLVPCEVFEVIVPDVSKVPSTFVFKTNPFSYLYKIPRILRATVFILMLLESEYECTAVFRKVENYITSGAAYHPTRPESAIQENPIQ